MFSDPSKHYHLLIYLHFYPSSERPKSVGLRVLAPFDLFLSVETITAERSQHHSLQVLCLRRVQSRTSRVTTHRLRYFYKAVYQGLKAFSRKKKSEESFTVKICSVCGTRFGLLHTAANSVRLKSLPASPDVFSHIPGERRRPRLSLGFSERRSKSWMQTNVNLDWIWLCEIPAETQRRTESKEKDFNRRGHPHTWEWQEEKDKQGGRGSLWTMFILINLFC